MDGWGNLSVSNLKYSIDIKKKINLDKFIYSLGIRHIGQENAKLLAKNFKNVENFFKLNEKKNFDELLNIDGIGDTQIKSLKNFFSNQKNIDVLLSLKKILTINNNRPVDNEGKLKNKYIMFTGKLDGISRAEAKSIVEKNAGKIISNVTKKLDFLIIGEKPTSRKVNLAKDLKIKILSQKEFFKLL